MKLNKNKIIVSALALAIGASLAGSVGGTVAWYQYSTRANVSFIGEAGGFSGNLQMRFASEAASEANWRTKITWQEMNAELARDHYAEKIVPMTFGKLDKDDALPNDGAQNPAPVGYIQPIAGISDMSKWVKADKKNYAQFKLQLRYNERDGQKEGDPAVDAKNVAKDVYLSKFVIQPDAANTAAGKSDLSDAVRVHIATIEGNTTKNKLISKKGAETATKGALDLDGDNHVDQAYPDGDEFGFTHDDSDLVDIMYGDDGDGVENDVQTSYAATYDPEFGGVKFTQDEIDNAVDGDAAYGKTVNDWKVNPADPALAYSENNVLYDDDTKAANPVAGKVIGKTIAGDNSYLTVVVTIWIEGWQKLDGSAIWDAEDYINSKFDIGIQFAVQDAYAE